VYITGAIITGDEEGDSVYREGERKRKRKRERERVREREREKERKGKRAKINERTR